MATYLKKQQRIFMITANYPHHRMYSTDCNQRVCYLHEMSRYISERVKWKVATWLLICIPVFKQISVCQWQILDFGF